MRQQNEPDKDNQKFLKKLDKFDQVSDKVFCWFGMVLGATVVALVVGTYVVNVVCGTATLEQFALFCVALLFLVAVPLCTKRMDFLYRWIFRKDIAMKPITMVLPERGTVTLDDALHKMSTPVAAFVWVIFLGVILFSIIFTTLCGYMDYVAVLCGAVVITILIGVGYPLLHLLWKKRSFVKKMVKNSTKYFPTEVDEGYADSVDASLHHGVMSYEKELIMTDDYILGIVESDTRFVPVAIPRAKITEYGFYYRRIVSSRYSRTIGILSCCINGETKVELVVGPFYKAQKVLRILDHYQIPWTEKPLTYA